MADNLSDTLKKLKITAVDRTEDSLEGCLDCLLQALAQNNMETSENIQGSGTLQLFANLLTPQSSCTAKVANIIAEVAKNGEVFLKNFSAGDIFSFTPYLSVCFIHLCFNFVAALELGTPNRHLQARCYLRIRPEAVTTEEASSSRQQDAAPLLAEARGSMAQPLAGHPETLLKGGKAPQLLPACPPPRTFLFSFIFNLTLCFTDEGRSAVDQAGGAQIVVDHLRSLCGRTDPANEKLLTVFCGMLMNYSNENDSLQAQLINMGVIPTLVKLLGIHCQNAALTEMCLVAFGNLAELESSKEQFASTNIAEELVKLFKKQIEHDKREMIFEVLAPLAENGEKANEHFDNFIILLLLGDESMQKLFEGGKGNVFQKVLSWLPSNNHQLQLAGALAIANFARNDGNCIHMVDSGIVEKLMDLLDRHVEDGNVTVQHAALSALRNLAIPGKAESRRQLSSSVDTVASLVERLVEWCEAKDHAGVMGESNRLLSALIRHSKSKDVIKTIVQSGGIKHLVTMATSEHVIMQNEALVALALIAALELGTAEKDLESAKLVQILHRLLADERSAPEIKYNSMVLICAVMGSESLHKEVQDLAFLDVISKLRSHENKSVAQQASLTEQRLTVES
ncbi:rap1 GTPase-GDP dissociation stimulator 1 [Trichechus manatus latirostris]|uniref:Rap1 GTPase-GDP dissociation stimulator 1 n=1 Tax=Trichechus manatus latirostris TaxID=127582 RepID=A0A2Y9QGT5_TRIMA|nr:rap1 GTPase-GDP dissociation stimulator 1 [Trichechus manatus latirostris]